MSDTFTERINQVREQRGLKQADICRATGFSSAQVASLVTGRTKDPKFSTAIKVAQALNVSLDWLGGLKDTPEVDVPPTLSRSEERLIQDFRASIPGERAKLSDYARERREISEASDVGSGSSEVA